MLAKQELAESAKKTGGRDQYFSRAVSKALETLEILHSAQEPVSLNDIAQRIQLSKTSAFRLLRTLETIGYITASSWGQYSLAPGAHSVVAVQFLARLLRNGAPRLQELSRELQETASLAALFDNRVEVIAVVESAQTLRMSNVVGHIVPPNASSLGKVITAFQAQERREKLIRSYGLWRFTEQTIVNRDSLDREFERIRAQKWAMDREETVPDGICFGVPIFCDGEEVPAAISVSIPRLRVRDAKHEKSILTAVTAAARQISADLQDGRPSRPGKTNGRAVGSKCASKRPATKASQ